MRRIRHIATALLGVAFFTLPHLPCHAGVVMLKNGWELSGKTAPVPSIGAEVLQGGANAKGQLIVVVDDELRRTFVSKHQIANLRDENVDRVEVLRLKQTPGPCLEGNRIGRIGIIVKATKFDKFGRRTVTIRAPGRNINVVQGITKVTPKWIRVQGLQVAKPYVWDMRIATTSIAPETLRMILKNHLDFGKPDVRLSLVRLYIQSDQYGLAKKELEQAIKDFPNLNQMNQQLRELRQLEAKQQLEEVKLRQSNGQHVQTKALLDAFPVEGAAVEILLSVSEMKEKYEADEALARKILATLQQQINEIKNEPERKLYTAFHRELKAEMNYNSLSRLSTYVRLMDDDTLQRDQKMALALSGWILNGNATENLAVAVSTWRVREIVKKYLVTEDPNERTALLQNLVSQDAGSPKYLAQILAGMKPPKRTPGLVDRLPEEGEQAPQAQTDPTGEGNNPRIPGYFVLTTDSLIDGKTVTYHVQLPPEYDANRRYPAVVSLHSAGISPESQITWWAGAYDKDLQIRKGQATRHGYIVIAPQWTKPKQRKYEYSLREHSAVLSALNDAQQRFSIDTDRVFLSGHSVGGDAAWDIALAHPGHWAGVIPFNAISVYEGKASPNYVSRYWKNAESLAFYFVGGALDSAKMDTNKQEFHRYLRRTGFDAMITEYLGRGHEPYYEEIHRIFDWMRVHERVPYPTQVNATIMRPWDNYFWWYEVGGKLADFPKNSMILPGAWPAKGVRPIEVSASIRSRKDIVVKTATSKAKLLLSPEMVDLDEKVTVYIGSRAQKIEARPEAKTILEDARRRGDRKHPYWVEVPLVTGRARR